MKFFALGLASLTPLLTSLCLAESKAPRSFWDWSTQWTESKFVSQVKKQDKAVSKKNWARVINLGTTALDGCLVLYHPQDQRCIIIMKNNVRAYAKTGQLQKYSKEITQAYQTASPAVGKQHFATVIIRDVYRQLLLDTEKYEATIQVVIETIDVEKSLQNDEFKLLDLEILLYALYKVTEQPQHQEPTLLRIMTLTEKLIGVDSENFYRAASTLAQTYCANKKYNEFFEVIAKYQLDTTCLSKDQQ